MRDILEDICITKRAHVVHRKKQMPESRLLADISSLDAPRGFQKKLTETRTANAIGLIAEIKKASPSRGVIREDFDPKKIATQYAEAGAACLSILTDTPYFQGHDQYIADAKSEVALPVLRKDFMLDTYQMVESRAIGADCVLLIVAVLEKPQMVELFAAARELGLDVLVEVHDEYELERALEHLPVEMLGINNRNLKTLEISLDISRRLAKYIPENVLKVAESGIKTHEDCQQLIPYGMSTFLVGESLMSEADIGKATRRLLGKEQEPDDIRAS